jgi:hypothetical protein
LGETEHNLEQIRHAPRISRRLDKTGRGIKPSEQIEVPEYDTTAWTGEGDSIRARPREKTAPGQFERRRKVVRIKRD